MLRYRRARKGKKYRKRSSVVVAKNRARNISVARMTRKKTAKSFGLPRRCRVVFSTENPPFSRSKLAFA
jgi:hypothetical protein